MGKTKEEIEAGARIFGQAAHTLGIIGEAVLNAEPFTGREVIAQNIIPAIVLKAFSCELFIKSLAMSADIKKIHKLNELFHYLRPSDRAQIKSSVINIMAKNDEQYTEHNFSVDLDNVANAFVDWRYFYEDTKSINLHFLNALFDTLWNYKTPIEID